MTGPCKFCGKHQEELEWCAKCGIAMCNKCGARVLSITDRREFLCPDCHLEDCTVCKNKSSEEEMEVCDYCGCLCCPECSQDIFISHELYIVCIQCQTELTQNGYADITHHGNYS